jgi:hypothetical protein
MIFISPDSSDRVDLASPRVERLDWRQGGAIHPIPRR